MPTKKLANAFRAASTALNEAVIKDSEVVASIEFVCRNPQNRAGVRVLLACALAKVNNPDIDIRKPYTEIGTKDCYSGRTYDEKYITHFINEHELPCNPTTAFLTLALRNRNIVLTTEVDLVGRPQKLYQQVLRLFDEVHHNRVSAWELLVETIRWLIIVREERRQRIKSLLANLNSFDENLPLSADRILKLIEQHLSCKGSSRLPVLIVAAAYRTASEQIGEKILPLKSHNAADEQTGALGDVEVTLINNDNIITGYEMKMKTVTVEDINRAWQKILNSSHHVHHYVFITTEEIPKKVQEYAESFYEKTNGIEIAILDCLGFLTHFLHLFYRIRTQFLDEYQKLVLEDTAVNQPLKETFLALRQTAESEPE